MVNQLTISELASRLVRREVSAREAMQSCLDQVRRVDGQLRAFLSYDAEDALAQADAADEQFAKGGPSDEQPLLGVPMAVKDVIAVQGQPLNCGSKILGTFRSPYNATVVARLKAAGAIIFGRLNMDEFAMGSSTENSGFFTTRNPWETSRIPGGSSGGSAVGVSAGECVAS
jgi:aspartyl-tRNA(Asn)/glutamyl-tRNA(Gln) amidotransferase subunit A